MNINEVHKFVVNLERRPDRLESIRNEMEYIGWEYELFKAVDTNSHVGCSLSHLEIIKLSLERNYDYVLIIEDDCTIMPYAKSLIEKIGDLDDLEFSIINLGPTLNRPVLQSEKNPYLLDITNLPPKKEHERGIFATNMILYHKSMYQDLLELEKGQNLGYYAIDDFIYQFISPKKQSFAPILPIGPQISSWSDVSGGVYNNFYTQTYNWNLYSPIKIPNEFLIGPTFHECKINKIHKDFIYEN
jgi:hypothetical protein